MKLQIEKLFENLTGEELKILKEQVKRFQELSVEKRRKIEIDDSVLLPKGTIIHGTLFDREVLSNIAETGILTGQLFDIPEDGETYYCADFHRLSEDKKLSDYNQIFPYHDGRCPFGRRGKKQVAFILYPDERMNSLIAYDCYRSGAFESESTKKFVNLKALPIDNFELASSILFGVPSCFINGIILGDNVITEENIEFVKSKFPDTFIVRNNGQIIYKSGDTKDISKLRLDLINETIEKEKTELDLKSNKQYLTSKEQEIDKLWEAISKLPLEDISQIYQSIGWQGDTILAAERLQTRYTNGALKK